MSASHLCGLHEPAAQAGLSCRFAAIHLLQTLVNILIFAISRKAKMQTSLAASAKSGPHCDEAEVSSFHRALCLL